jgi:Tfp pilus assembly protein PilN
VELRQAGTGRRRAAVGVLALGLLSGLPARAQEPTDDLKREIEALKQGQLEIQKQLNEIKRLLQAQQRPQAPPQRGPEVKDVVFDISSAAVKGPKSAQLTLIEFTDYQ